MNKIVILWTTAVLAIITGTILISDGPAYLIVSLMAFTIMIAIYRNKTRVMKMTRWSKANPGQAQLLITGLQVVLLPLGIITGNNLKELGYEFSDTTTFVFGAILVIGFFYVPFLPQQKTIVLPKQVNRQRFAFMSIALSSFVIMVLFGNRLQDNYPNSFITKTVKAIDQAIFPNNAQATDPYDIASASVLSEDYNQDVTGESSAKAVFASIVVNHTETITPLPGLEKDSLASLKADKDAKKFEKKLARQVKNLLKKHRLAFAGISGGVAVLLIILLCIPLCAGVCLIISGGGAGSILGGIALLAASIFGISQVSKSRKKSKEAKL